MGGPVGERITLTLRAGGLGEEDLHVASVEGREGLSEPFLFDVVFAPASGDALEPAAFLREEAVLALRRPGGAERFVHGECVRLALVEVAAGRPVYRLRLAPKLLRLSHVVQSRIFQDMAVPAVVKAVLGEHGIDVRDALTGNHAPRTYVTQYRESDLAFVERLLSEEGIWYRFDHAEGGHTLVLADAPSALAAAAAPVPQRIGGEQGEGIEHVARLDTLLAVTTGKVTERDFDFERPRVDLSQAKGSGDLEAYEYPGGFTQASDGKRLAGLRLEALAVPAALFAGAGNALAFVPGAKVELEDGPTVGVVRVTHSAAQERAAGAAGKGSRYANSFAALPAATPYRPPVRPRPRMGIQTATVTGPAGEEIHVDSHGRIKVQLHWDRQGKRDDRSSCWVRVAQPWAGAGWGASRIPRIGQEVVVRWLEGDPDRPLVTGAVFNGANARPVALPRERTRAVLRSDSSPGSNGSNELTLEDAAGEEELLVHGQKDWSGVVEADRTEAVGHDAELTVAKDRSRTVSGAQRRTVGQDEAIRVDGSATVTVAGRRDERVAASADERIGVARTVTVAATRTVGVAAASAENVGGAAALTVGAAYFVSVGGALNHAVGGLKNTAVAGAAVEVVGLSREESVSKRKSSRVGGDHAIQVKKGGATLLTGEDHDEQIGGAVEIEAKEALTILCKDGKVEADKISVIVGGKLALVLKKGDVKVAGDAVTLEADGDLKVKGSKAKMESGSAAASGSATVKELKDLDPAKKFAKVQFKDKRGDAALAEVKFKLKTPSGDKQGVVSPSGLMQVGDLKPGKCTLELDFD